MAMPQVTCDTMDSLMIGASLCDLPPECSVPPLASTHVTICMEGGGPCCPLWARYAVTFDAEAGIVVRRVCML